MRDWLTVIIVLLIVGIVLDAFRRMRHSRKESIQLSHNAKKADKESTPVRDSSEFPSGGARVVTRRAPEAASDLNKNIKKSFEAKKTTVGAPNRIPEQVTLNLDEHVPMLMDSVVEQAEAEDPTDPIAPTFEPELGDLDSLDEVPEQDDSPESEIEQTRVVESPLAETTSEDVEDFEEEQEYAQPDEVLIINVMASQGTCYSGEALLSALMAQGMKLGAMDIFHRHINDDGDGPVLFSLANMVVPGTFNLAKMKEFNTPGVSLFLSLPLGITDENDELIDGLCIRAYDDMAKTAKALAKSLGGELMDKNRSVMKQQTIDYDRELVVEYERKQRLANR